MTTTVTSRSVRIVAADHPAGRIVVRLVDSETGELVRAGESAIHFDSVAAALEACAANGLSVA